MSKINPGISGFQNPASQNHAAPAPNPSAPARTELVFILDRSGSMSGREADVVGGFNSLIEEHRKTGGTVYVSTLLFDDSNEVLHDRVDIRSVSPITEREYFVRGCTALLDAIGDAIHHIGNVHKYARKEDVPEKTIIVIMTDGMENASRRYGRDEILRKVKRQQEKYGWEFLFLGANIDAIATAAGIGIRADRAVDTFSDADGISSQWDSVSHFVMSSRCCSTAPGSEWKQEIEEDLRKRRKKQGAK